MVENRSQKILHFGGTIGTTSGTRAGKAVVLFGEIPKNKIGSKDFNMAHNDVVFVFDNVKSIDVIIEQLELCKKYLNEIQSIKAV